MSNELYFSVDVETDGPIPGPYSMVSFGMSAILLRKGEEYVDLNADAAENQFYAELKPISEQYVPEALAVSGLDRDLLIKNGQDPAAAMTDSCRWVTDVAALHKARPIFAAYPLGFDWMFWYWYAVNYSTIHSPFGHSAHIDIKTAYAQRADAPISKSTKRWMPKFLFSATRKHTHNGLDDAIEQGELLANILRWNGKSR